MQCVKMGKVKYKEMIKNRQIDDFIEKPEKEHLEDENIEQEH